MQTLSGVHRLRMSELMTGDKQQHEQQEAEADASGRSGGDSSEVQPGYGGLHHR